jgi:hypothetical protein
MSELLLTLIAEALGAALAALTVALMARLMPQPARPAG